MLLRQSAAQPCPFVAATQHETIRECVLFCITWQPLRRCLHKRGRLGWCSVPTHCACPARFRTHVSHLDLSRPECPAFKKGLRTCAPPRRVASCFPRFMAAFEKVSVVTRDGPTIPQRRHNRWPDHCCHCVYKGMSCRSALLGYCVCIMLRFGIGEGYAARSGSQGAAAQHRRLAACLRTACCRQARPRLRAQGAVPNWHWCTLDLLSGHLLRQLLIRRAPLASLHSPSSLQLRSH